MEEASAFFAASRRKSAKPENDLSGFENRGRQDDRKFHFYCRMLGVSRQGFYKYLANKDRPWKYQDLADAMKEIASEDEYNDATDGSECIRRCA